ncbi:L,D-transpeptidase family protein [Moritella viscosa]|nr:L,D-transpeptidase family protein [Moritella viscosa]SGZ13723.1 Putative uncharacterized protein [Moritella viscosa]SHO27859.1 Putative uncharacterized protein [Moritella viscosa]
MVNLKLNLSLPSICFILVILLLHKPVHSQPYAMPILGSRLIGQPIQYTVKVGDYFHAIAEQYNVGMMALMASNPTVDPFLPRPGTVLELPTSMLLPDAPYKGIVINLPELRLYYFPQGKNIVHVFPVGIGREGRTTPQMNSFVKAKLKDPIWTPTPSTRAEYLQKFKTVLPRYVDAGEHNPLGRFALQLAYGQSNYLIHGTNQRFGIGMRISAGCIRMNPDDIELLYTRVAINEPVRIINKPIKFTIEPNGQYLVEVHTPLSSETLDGDLNMAETIDRFEHHKLDEKALNNALLLHYGLPVNVSI